VTPLDYEYLRKLLKERSGLDLSADKQYLVESRLLPLARKSGVPGIPELVLKMKGGAEALTSEVVEAMTTNETFFFRDKIPFEHLKEAVLPALLQARAARRFISSGTTTCLSISNGCTSRKKLVSLVVIASTTFCCRPLASPVRSRLTRDSSESIPSRRATACRRVSAR